MHQSAANSEPVLPQSRPQTRRFKSSRAVMALMLREIAATDSRTSLGFLWAVIEPVGTIALLTLMFSFLTHNPPLGTNFPLFYVTGVIPFQIYTSVGNKVSGAVRFSRPLLGFPSVTALDAVLARFILNYFITVAVFCIVTGSIIWFYELQVSVDIPKMVLALVMSGMLALGFGTFNAVIFMAVPTYENLWGILSRPLMLISGVLFLISDLPDRYAQYLWWNPVAHPIALMRAAFYPSAPEAEISPLFVAFVSLTAFTIGLVTLHRYVRDALDK